MACAIVTDDLRPGALGLCGDVDVLTVDRGTSSLAQGDGRHTGVVEVET